MAGKVVVLLSGGLDSTTCLAIAKNLGHELYAISFDYGQKHKEELGSARRVARHYGVKEHLITQIRFQNGDQPNAEGAFAGSALVDASKAVPKDGVKPGIAPTYVPGRNMIFLSFGLGWADSLDAESVFIGVNALDYSGYPDCRPEFISAMEDAAALGTRMGVEGGGCVVNAPLVQMTKKEIVLKGHELDVPWNLTHSCYAPEPRGFWEKEIMLACGKCDSCRLRLKGFEEAGLKDPISYV